MKDIVILIARIVLFLAGIALTTSGYYNSNQTFLYVGLTCTIVAFLLSIALRRKSNDTPEDNKKEDNQNKDKQ